MAAWMTPCSSWIVNEAGTSTRRQIIGLMPSRRIFSCRIGPAGEVKVRRVLPGITDLGRWPPQATQPPHLALPAPHALWRSPRLRRYLRLGYAALASEIKRPLDAELGVSFSVGV